MKSDYNGLHLIREGEEKSHANVRAELSKSQCGKRIFFWKDSLVCQWKYFCVNVRLTDLNCHRTLYLYPTDIKKLQLFNERKEK